MNNDQLDVEVYYKMARGAIDEKDISQALKISENGLKKAESLQDDVWISKFISLRSEIENINENQTHLTGNATIKDYNALEEISRISGVGSSVAELLYNSGFNSIETITKSTPNQLSQIKGIGPKKAQIIIDNAIFYSASCGHIKSLNSFGHPSQDTTNLLSNQKMQQDPQKKLFEEQLKRLNSNVWNSSLESREQEFTSKLYSSEHKKEQHGERIEDPFEDDDEFFYNDDMVEEKAAYSEIISNFLEDNQKTVNIEFIENDNVGTEVFSKQNVFASEHEIPLYGEQDKDESEKINFSKIRNLINRLILEFKERGFSILPKNSSFESIYKSIDIIAIKPIKVDELLDILLIIPMKVSQLQGSVVVSRNNIDYVPYTKESNFSNKKSLEFYISRLKEVQDNIFTNIINKRELFNYFKEYQKMDFSFVISHSNKNLCLVSGPLQSRIIIEPILVSIKNVGFLEEILPFAYLSNSNIHIVTLKDSVNLLEYLEKKYILIERYSEKEDNLTTYFKLHKKFIERERYFSIPILCFGFVALLVVLVQGFYLLDLILNLGYAFITLYTITSLYIYHEFYKVKSALKSAFYVPYYERKHTFDDSSLVLINNELSPRLMNQFSYECLGKTFNFKVISEIEEQQAQDRIIQHKIQEKNESSELFEPTESSIKNNIIKKFSSFLED